MTVKFVALCDHELLKGLLFHWHLAAADAVGHESYDVLGKSVANFAQNDGPSLDLWRTTSDWNRLKVAV